MLWTNGLRDLPLRVRGKLPNGPSAMAVKLVWISKVGAQPYITGIIVTYLLDMVATHAIFFSFISDFYCPFPWVR